MTSDWSVNINKHYINSTKETDCDTLIWTTMIVNCDWTSSLSDLSIWLHWSVCTHGRGYIFYVMSADLYQSQLLHYSFSALSFLHCSFSMVVISHLWAGLHTLHRLSWLILSIITPFHLTGQFSDYQQLLNHDFSLVGLYRGGATYYIAQIGWACRGFYWLYFVAELLLWLFVLSLWLLIGQYKHGQGLHITHLGWGSVMTWFIIGQLLCWGQWEIIHNKF